MTDSAFVKHFKNMCEIARQHARASSEQAHVVSFKYKNERPLAVVLTSGLPAWLTMHEREEPSIHHSTPVVL